ncbi:MAG: Hsp20/alpha crystallin family protein [Myxococcales bacterium]|jgi:HSP20 family protein
MADLSRWLPFKSRRKSAEEKKSTAVQQRSEEAGAGSSQLSPLFSSSMPQLMQRMFDEPFFTDPFAPMADLDRWFGDFAPARFQPSVDVVDEETALRVTAELPGMDKDDIQLNVEGDVLTIRGEKKNEEEKKEQGVFRTERYYGYFQRSIPLPRGIDLDRTEAEFKKGVLTVRLPKGAVKEEKGTSIPIKG